MQKRCLFLGLLPIAAGILATASCQQTVTNAPLRTFERAQKMDVVCMHVRADDGNGEALDNPTLAPLSMC